MSSVIEQQKESGSRKVLWAFSDMGVLIKRSLTHIFKNLDQLLSVALQPIMFMLLFRYVFGGAINTGGVSYVNFLVGGILVQNAAFGAQTTSISVATDVKRGVIDRFKSLPMLSSAVMVGHVIADLVRNTMSAIIMVLVAFVIGFRPVATLGEWLIIWGVLLLFTFAFSWLSAVIGLLAKSVEAVQWIGFVLVFPLTFASSTFVPTAGMPKFLRLFAEHQPITHVIETIRSYMIGAPVGNHALAAVLWCVGLTAVCVPLAAYLFRTKSVS